MFSYHRLLSGAAKILARSDPRRVLIVMSTRSRKPLEAQSSDRQEKSDEMCNLTMSSCELFPLLVLMIEPDLYSRFGIDFLWPSKLRIPSLY